MDWFLHTFSFWHQHRRAPNFDVFSFIDLATEYGSSGDNVSAYGPEYRELLGARPSHIDRVRSGLEANRLKIDIETNGTSLNRLQRYLDLAVELGTRNLRTYSLHKGTPPEGHERLLRDLEEVVPAAQKCGIKLLLENHEDISGVELAATLI